MLLLFGIAALWTATLLLVAGLCMAAGRGDRELRREAATARASAPAPTALPAARGPEGAAVPFRVAA